MRLAPVSHESASASGVLTALGDLKRMRELARTYRPSAHLANALAIPWTAEDFTNANMVRKSVVRKMAEFMGRYDLLLTPTLAVPPFAIHMQGPEKIDGRYVSRPNSCASLFC
jgi:aspartyl-tRNA(Asn)/glutamyl-tRNA(Gln) amidotransferase subunit A